MTNVSTGILDDDGSDGNGQHTNDTEQINDANLLCQHKEQWPLSLLIAIKIEYTWVVNAKIFFNK